MNDNPQIITDKFNEYYANIATKVVQELPPTDANFLQYLPARDPVEILWEPCTTHEVKRIVKKCNDVKPGPDGIPMHIFKKNIEILAPVLSNVCNKSLQQGVFPEIHKKGVIIPIYKNKDKYEISNYRPICLLNAISKILEKLVANRIMAHLERNNLLSNSQYAYRKGMGTDLATTKFVSDVIHNFDRNQYSLSVFLDLTKAFDCVNHRILATKLKYFGINNLAYKWLVDYLHNRKQYVKYNGVVSKDSNINIGVPRGSILGPILFLIYIDDLNRAGHAGDLILFADDGNYYESSEDYFRLINSVDHNLSLITQWFLANQLSINIIKSEAMLFSRKLIYFPLPPVTLNGSPIPYNFTYKFLGLHLDFKLKWKNHLHHIGAKLSSVCGILYRTRNMITKDIAKTIYYSIAYSYLNYCNIVWSSCHPSHLQSLINIQKKLIRLVMKRNRWSPSAPLFRELKALTLLDINKVNTLVFVYKSLNNVIRSPIDFQYRIINEYNLRNNQSLVIPLHHTKQTELFVHVRGSRLWNEIPIELRLKPNVNSFKFNLKKYYLDFYQEAQ